MYTKVPNALYESGSLHPETFNGLHWLCWSTATETLAMLGSGGRSCIKITGCMETVRHQSGRHETHSSNKSHMLVCYVTEPRKVSHTKLSNCVTCKGKSLIQIQGVQPCHSRIPLA